MRSQLSKSYIICATPRSGTTLLCDLLTDTGVAGRPDSFFRIQSKQWWANYLNIPIQDWVDENSFDHAFLNAVIQQGCAGTETFGMRLMWRDFTALSNQLKILFPNLTNDYVRFSQAFGSIVFVHLTRENKIDQAISLIRAEQSGLWHVNADGIERERIVVEKPPTYNAQQIQNQVNQYKAHDAAWVDWFTQQNIQPLRITYESLCDSPQEVVKVLLSALDEDMSLADKIIPRTRKLSNQINHDWVNRFLLETKSAKY